MSYLLKKPAGYPEISFLSFDALALIRRIQCEMGLDSIGPVSLTLQTMETLAGIRRKQGIKDLAIYFHSLFNRPDVPQPVIEHVLRHELLHLKIPARVIDGRLVHHPPEFWEAQQALAPWKAASWEWMFLAFSGVIKADPLNECVWVKNSWRKLQNHPYPSWKMVLDNDNRITNREKQLNSLMESL